jgi:hypothetical protein
MGKIIQENFNQNSIFFKNWTYYQKTQEDPIEKKEEEITYL